MSTEKKWKICENCQDEWVMLRRSKNTNNHLICNVFPSIITVTREENRSRKPLMIVVRSEELGLWAQGLVLLLLNMT